MIRKLILVSTICLLTCFYTFGQAVDNISIRVLLNEFPDDISWELQDGDYKRISTSDFSECQPLSYCNQDFWATKDCYRLIITDKIPSDDESNIRYEVLFNGMVVISSFLTDSLKTHSFGCEPGRICESAAFQHDSDTILWPPVENYWIQFIPPKTGLYQIQNCDLNERRRFPETEMHIYEQCLPQLSAGPEGAIAHSQGYSFCPPSSGFNAIPMRINQPYYIRLSLLDRVTWEDSIALTIARFDDNPGCTDPQACNYYPFATEEDGSCMYTECLPDLEVDQQVFEESIFLDSILQSDACLISEGCLSGFGMRHIIRFSTLIKNVGLSDYIIGSPEDNHVGFSRRNCHQHYHQLGYAEYILFGGDGQPAPIGFKNGFCVQDSDCPTSDQRYFCNYMGITAGCEDLYASDVLCQWVDITDVASGEYTLVARINWSRLPDLRGFQESDYDNNWAQVCVRIDQSGSSPSISILESDCGVYRDCMGVAYGNTVMDCNNVCGGTGHFADLNQNGELDQVDVREYSHNLASQGFDLQPCFDLNADGVLSVFDVVMAQSCLSAGINNTESHNHCLFPAGRSQTEDSIRLIISSMDTLAKHFTLAYTSKHRDIKALQIQFEGVEISNVEPLVSTGFADYNSSEVFLVDSTKLLPRTLEVIDFVRVDYNSVDAVSFCIHDSEAINNRDERIVSYHGFPSDCSFSTSTEDNELSGITVSPNPAVEYIFIESEVKIDHVQLYNVGGKLMNSWNHSIAEEDEFSIKGLPKGVYLLRIHLSNNRIISQKLLKY